MHQRLQGLWWHGARIAMQLGVEVFSLCTETLVTSTTRYDPSCPSPEASSTCLRLFQLLQYGPRSPPTNGNCCFPPQIAKFSQASRAVEEDFELLSSSIDRLARRVSNVVLSRSNEQRQEQPGSPYAPAAVSPPPPRAGTDARLQQARSNYRAVLALEGEEDQGEEAWPAARLQGRFSAAKSRDTGGRQGATAAAGRTADAPPVFHLRRHPQQQDDLPEYRRHRSPALRAQPPVPTIDNINNNERAEGSDWPSNRRHGVSQQQQQKPMRGARAPEAHRYSYGQGRAEGAAGGGAVPVSGGTAVAAMQQGSAGGRMTSPAAGGRPSWDSGAHFQQQRWQQQEPRHWQWQEGKEGVQPRVEEPASIDEGRPSWDSGAHFQQQRWQQQEPHRWQWQEGGEKVQPRAEEPTSAAWGIHNRQGPLHRHDHYQLDHHQQQQWQQQSVEEASGANRTASAAARWLCPTPSPEAAVRQSESVEVKEPVEEEDAVEGEAWEGVLEEHRRLLRSGYDLVDACHRATAEALMASASESDSSLLRPPQADAGLPAAAPAASSVQHRSHELLAESLSPYLQTTPNQQRGAKRQQEEEQEIEQSAQLTFRSRYEAGAMSPEMFSPAPAKMPTNGKRWNESRPPAGAPSSPSFCGILSGMSSLLSTTGVPATAAFRSGTDGRSPGPPVVEEDRSRVVSGDDAMCGPSSRGISTNGGHQAGTTGPGVERRIIQLPSTNAAASHLGGALPLCASAHPRFPPAHQGRGVVAEPFGPDSDDARPYCDGRPRRISAHQRHPRAAPERRGRRLELSRPPLRADPAGGHIKGSGTRRTRQRRVGEVRWQ